MEAKDIDMSRYHHEDHPGGKPDHHHSYVGGSCIGCGQLSEHTDKIYKEVVAQNKRALVPSSINEMLQQTTAPIDQLLKERGRTHGEWDSQSRLAHDLKSILWASPNFAHLPPFIIEAAEMHCTKISRCVCGDPYEPDHWADIAGYARLVEKQLLEEKQNERSRKKTDTGSGNGSVQT